MKKNILLLAINCLFCVNSAFSGEHVPFIVSVEKPRVCFYNPPLGTLDLLVERKASHICDDYGLTMKRIGDFLEVHYPHGACIFVGTSAYYTCQ